MVRTVCTLINPINTVLLHEMLYLLCNEMLSRLRHKRDVRYWAVICEHIGVTYSCDSGKLNFFSHLLFFFIKNIASKFALTQ